MKEKTRPDESEDSSEGATKFVEKGKKITVEKCPHCKQELVVQEKDGAEVFICENCKFKVKK